MPWPPRSATRWRCTGRCGRLDGVEFRFHRTVLYNSIYRADDQVLVNTHLFGVTAAHAPVWHLRKLPAGELAGLYIDSFERVWETATPVDGA